MTNRLAQQTSPYLLQHAENPVDWYPWGPEAIELARSQDRPLFVSIGYSACHWCHVMERESFENPQIAARLNEKFVSVKIDREERPDLDQIYMNAVQMLSGHGGWPLSVFLTPDLEPFYGGTYWPPESRLGMPGFDQVLSAVDEAWQNRRGTLLEQARQLTDRLREIGRAGNVAGQLSAQPLQAAEAELGRVFDPRHGGFGEAPKFPHPMQLRVLLRQWRHNRRDSVLQMVTFTLQRMAAGGIYDHLGGGFHRYAVDERWLVPHFEKMLYDNALLAGCYLEAFQATARPDFARVVRETLDYVLGEMTDPAGGFYSTQDADSEGVEGKFYVWTPEQVVEVLGPRAAETFCYVYDVSEQGNFDRGSILNLPKTLEQCAIILKRDAAGLDAELADGRAKLLDVRNRRVAPGLDDKVLVAWNGLMIDSLAQASGTLGEDRYLAAAIRAAEFILQQMRRGDGRLLHSWRQGRARFDAYLDDYACLANALVSLYEACFLERWIDEAVKLADVLLSQFADEAGGFFYTARDHEPLIVRNKDVQDSSVPSGNAMAATVLLRLGKLCGRNDYLQAAQRTLETFAHLMQRSAMATGQMLIALDMHQGPTPQIVLLGADDPLAPGAADTETVLAHLRRRYWPNKVVAKRPAQGNSPALADIFARRQPGYSEPTLFMCENFTCSAPVVGVPAILAAWDDYPAGSNDN